MALPRAARENASLATFLDEATAQVDGLSTSAAKFHKLMGSSSDRASQRVQIRLKYVGAFATTPLSKIVNVATDFCRFRLLSRHPFPCFRVTVRSARPCGFSDT